MPGARITGGGKTRPHACGGTGRGPRAARFSPKDHHGGDASIDSVECTGFLAASAAPAAGARCLSAGWRGATAAGVPPPQAPATAPQRLAAQQPQHRVHLLAGRPPGPGELQQVGT
jgi:hypothetical protein